MLPHNQYTLCQKNQYFSHENMSTASDMAAEYKPLNHGWPYSWIIVSKHGFFNSVNEGNILFSHFAPASVWPGTFSIFYASK
jgi:hypothetical protein